MINKFIIPTAAGVLIAVFLYANLYTGFGTEKSVCNTAEDCISLSHIECTGKWVCEIGQCGWVCASNGSKSSSNGGLGGATVECVVDDNCPAGGCSDSTTYKRYSCQGNRCVEINYFADPCKYK
jgi:hypothetical protein